MRERCAALLEEFADRIDGGRLERLRTLSRVGEWGYFLNTLCGGLVANRSRITPAERDALGSFLRYFGETNPDLKYASSPETTLAALNVTDR